MANPQQVLMPKKYGIELKRSTRGEWYIGSLSINADTKEEFEQAMKEAIEIASEGLEELQKRVAKILAEKSQEFLKK